MYLHGGLTVDYYYCVASRVLRYEGGEEWAWLNARTRRGETKSRDGFLSIFEIRCERWAAIPNIAVSSPPVINYSPS